MNGWKQSGKRRESDTEEKLTRLISGLVNLTHSEATAVSLMGVLKQINLATESMVQRNLDKVHELQSLVDVKDQHIQKLQAELEKRTQELSNEEKQVSDLKKELAEKKDFVELHRKKNEQLQEKNSTALEALSASVSMLQRKCSEVDKLQAQLVAKDQEVQMLQVELEKRTQEQTNKIELITQKASTTESSTELHILSLEKQVSDLQNELAEAKDFVELQRTKNNQLREKNWSAMEALSATESMVRGKLCKVNKLQAQLVAKDQEVQTLQVQLEKRTQELTNEIERINQKASTAESSTALQILSLQKQVSDSKKELAETKDCGASKGKERAASGEKLYWIGSSFRLSVNVAKEISKVDKLQAQLVAKDQEVQTLQVQLEKRTQEQTNEIELITQKASTTESSTELHILSLEKQVSDLQNELAEAKDFVELQRTKNNQLREKNWSAMEALSATESMVRGKLCKVNKLQAQLVAKDQEVQTLQVQLEKRTQELTNEIERINQKASTAESSTALQILSLQKQVSDSKKEQRKSKSYYVGLLQEKNQDIAAEISKLENHIKKFSIDEADYLHVVEQNKTLAHDIKDLEANLELLKKMDILQEEMDLLVKRKEDYEAELAHNNDKSEMLTLYKELTAKWETLQAGRKAQDPQGMEPLIKKMEKDSKELASIEKQLADLRDKEKEMKQRIHQFPDYMKEYDMLKMREEKLDQLLASVEIAKAAEQEKIPHIQENIASLSQLCYSYVRNCCMDSETAEKLKKMMTLVVNNSTKAIQLESSARRLAPEIELLRQDLKQVHTWKSKVCRDLSSLKEQTSIVESELGTHRTQRRSAHKSEKKLHEEYELLTKRQRYFRQVLEDLNHEFNNLRKGLMKTEEKQKTLEVLSGLSKAKSYTLAQ
eukprot:XP_011615277.1 PREDICTED: kinectin-like [Takifugu rubripes]